MFFGFWRLFELHIKMHKTTLNPAKEEFQYIIVDLNGFCIHDYCIMLLHCIAVSYSRMSHVYSIC